MLALLPMATSESLTTGVYIDAHNPHRLQGHRDAWSVGHHLLLKCHDATRVILTSMPWLQQGGMSGSKTIARIWVAIRDS